VSKVDSTGTYSFKRDGAGVTAPLLSDGAASYTPGVSERRGTTTRYYANDFQGSVVRQVRPDQTTSTSRRWDAFGNLLTTTATTPPATPFGYAGAHGYQEDKDSGLKLLGHRYYDPSTGRFLTRDPIKDGRNWYAYCENNPNKWVDPNGLIRMWIYKLWQEGREVLYHIIPGQGRRPAKTYAKSIDPSDEVTEHASGHNGGPGHFHNEGNHDIHVTSEGLADQSEADDWKNWRKKSRPIPALVEGLDPTPIGAGQALGEGLADAVDPMVRTAQARRQKSLEYWLSTD